MNSLYQQLNQNRNPQSFLANNNGLRNLISMFKNSNNPQQLLNSMIQTNPQMQSIYALIKSSNKSPKDLFYSLAEQKGIDP